MHYGHVLTTVSVHHWLPFYLVVLSVRNICRDSGSSFFSIAPKMPITNYDETSSLATKYLSAAVQAEYNRNWTKAIQHYQRLMHVIELDHLPQPYIPPLGYKMTLFEAHFHHGVCYQHTANHGMAIQYFSNAIEAVLSPKNGCLLGCCSPVSLSIPARARLAFSLASLGRHKEALRHLDMAANLDLTNLDILCTKIIVNTLARDHDRACKLLNQGLSDRGTLEHPGCQALQRHIHNPKSSSQSDESFEELDYPEQLEFINRFLFTLHLSHSITEINLTPLKADTMNCAACWYQGLADNLQVMSRAKLPIEIMKWRQVELSNIKPFKCGLVHMHPDPHPVTKELIHATKHRRRLEYSYNVLSQSRATTAQTSADLPDCTINKDGEESLQEWALERNPKAAASNVEMTSREVARTYIRGWKGDKLVSASRPYRVNQPIFYPAYS